MWVFGMLASLAATCSSGLGDNLIKLSYHQERKYEQKHGGPKRGMCKRPLWMFGWFLSAGVDTALNALALYLASLEVVMPLGGMHILWGALFAHVINKETVGVVGWIGALMIVGGVAMVLVAAPGEADLTYDQSAALLASAKFAIIMSVYGSLILGTAFITHVSSWAAAKPYTAPALAGLCGANSNFLLKFVETLMGSLGKDRAHPELPPHPFRWEHGVSLFLLIAMGAAQLTSLNHALQHYEACTVVAVANSVMMLGGTLYGVLCYSSDERLSAVQLSLLAGGVVVVCFGIVLLSNRKHFARGAGDDVESSESSSAEESTSPSHVIAVSRHADYGTLTEDAATAPTSPPTSPAESPAPAVVAKQIDS